MGTAYESEYDYDSFKAYMQRDYAMKTEEQSNNIVTNVSIYEVLTKIVSHLERYRPDDPMDFIEKEFINIKRKIKHDKAHLRNDLMEMKEEQKIFDESGINNLCENLKRNLKKFENLSNDSSASTENYNGFQDENFSWKIYDLIEDMHNFRRVGVGISEAESAKVWISMRILAEKYGHFTKSVRFWGKIYGTIKNYYILELDKEIVEGSEEPEDDNIDLEDINKENNEAILDPSDSSSNNIANSKAQKVKSKVKVPKEINSGTNKFIYFFSNDPSLNDWRKLPDVEPEHIVESRYLKRYFTGIADSTVPGLAIGKESILLRTQIARITSATHISPAGYYISADDGSDMESASGKDSNGVEDEEAAIRRIEIIENDNFEEIPIQELAESGLSNWCHHSPYILPQGRTIWWNRNNSQNADRESDEDQVLGSDELDSNDQNSDSSKLDKLDKLQQHLKIEPEVGPAILSQISDDIHINKCPAWTISLECADQMQKSRCGLVLIKSQLWPGAYTVARNGGKYFRNVYIGKGIKYEGGFQHTPPALPRLMIECTKSESITEIQDPSLEEEIIAQRSAQSKNADGSDKDVDSDKDERNTSDESRSSSSE